MIHAVGPCVKNYSEASDEERALLRSAVVKSLEAAAGLHVRSISIPAISTGIYGFPLDVATDIIVDAVVQFVLSLETSSEVLRLIRLVAWSQRDFDAFRSALGKHST